MRTRPVKPSDVPILDAWAKASGYPYPSNVGDCVCVVDENDQPIAACSPNMIVELYLWADPDQHPAAKLAAIRALHDSMIPMLRVEGISEVNAFLPPEIAAKFGRRLERTFGWVKNWQSWAKRF